MANTTVNIDIQVQSKSLQELESELKDINDQLKQVPVGSEAFTQLSQRSQEVTKSIKGINSEIEGFTLEKKVRAAQGSVTALAGGLEATVGTLGLLGVESEVFGKFEEKAISAIAAGRGFIDIADGVGILTQNINLATIKAKIFGITTKQALISTGILAFVVVLGSIIAYWDDITKGVEKFGQKVPFVGKAIDTIKDAFDRVMEAARPVLEFLGLMPDEFERANTAAIEANDELITSLEREIAVLQASGASAEEVYNKKKELLEAELDNLNRNEAEKEEIYKKETELLVLQAQEVTRKRKEEEDKRTKDTEKAADDRVKAEEEAAEKILQAREKAEAEYRKELRSIATYEQAQLAADEASAMLIENAEERAEKLLGIERRRLVEEKRLREVALEEAVEQGLLYDSDLKDQLTLMGYEYRDKEKLLEIEHQKELTQIRLDEQQRFADTLLETYNSIYSTLTTLSQDRYDRELINLQRQRSEIESNAYLTVEERERALDEIEEKEKDAEIRRIKAQRDQATISQAIALSEFIFKEKLRIQELLGIGKITIAKAQAAATDVATEGATQVGKASMSLGQFVAQLGPLGIIAYAASIGGIIATIVSARRKANAQIAALSSASIGSAPGVSAPTVPTPPVTQNIQPQAPQTLTATPMLKTYVLTGDITSGQEAEAKLNTKRTIS